MSFIENIKSKYADYRLNKINNLEMSINNAHTIKASSQSPPKLMPDKLEITLKTLPKQLSIAKNMESTVKSLNKNPSNPKNKAENEFIQEFEDYATSAGIDKIGYVKVPEHLIFQDRSIKYPYAMILIMEMDKEAVDKAPNPETDAMGVITYDKLGKITNQLTSYLREKGFAAQASHPAGGFVVYPPLAQEANMGFIGRHGLLITPEFGPRQRIAAIFTGIENLPLPTKQQKTPEFCDKCGKCLKVCPGKAIVEEITPEGRRTSILNDKCHGCTICMRECNFNKIDYHKLEST